MPLNRVQFDKFVAFLVSKTKSHVSFKFSHVIGKVVSNDIGGLPASNSQASSGQLALLLIMGIVLETQ